MVYGVTRIELPHYEGSPPLPAGSMRHSRQSVPTGEQCGGDNLSVTQRKIRGNSWDPPAPCFVAGPENRLVVPLLQRLLAGQRRTNACDAPSPGGDSPSNSVATTIATFVPSPIVLTGGPGTGKSLLARAIIRRYSQQLDPTAVSYFTAVDFGRQLHGACGDSLSDSWREQLAHLQVLVLEDLQRLSPSGVVQRCLRETVDQLITQGALVLCTANKPPACLPQLEAGLRDRLCGGLTLQLRTPGAAARQELEQLTAGPQRQPAAPLPRENVTLEQNPVPDLKQIFSLVARYFSLTQAALRSSSRRQSLVYARGIAVWLARTVTPLSYAQIGKALGGRDHTTMLHAHQKIAQLLATDQNTQQALDELRRILTAR